MAITIVPTKELKIVYPLTKYKALMIFHEGKEMKSIRGTNFSLLEDPERIKDLKRKFPGIENSPFFNELIQGEESLHVNDKATLKIFAEELKKLGLHFEVRE